jgi:hypothetical protein
MNSEFKGEFVNGKRHGKGILKERGKNSVSTIFRHGLLTGSTHEELLEIRESFKPQNIQKIF